MADAATPRGYTFSRHDAVDADGLTKKRYSSVIYASAEEGPPVKDPKSLKMSAGQLRKIVADMNNKRIPLFYEHRKGARMGQVEGARLEQNPDGTWTAYADFRLDSNTPMGAATIEMWEGEVAHGDLGKPLRNVSLGHALDTSSGAVEALELTLCMSGARQGTVVINASRSEEPDPARPAPVVVMAAPVPPQQQQQQQPPSAPVPSPPQQQQQQADMSATIGAELQQRLPAMIAAFMQQQQQQMRAPQPVQQQAPAPMFPPQIFEAFTAALQANPVQPQQQPQPLYPAPAAPFPQQFQRPAAPAPVAQPPQPPPQQPQAPTFTKEQVAAMLQEVGVAPSTAATAADAVTIERQTGSKRKVPPPEDEVQVHAPLPQRAAREERAKLKVAQQQPQQPKPAAQMVDEEDEEDEEVGANGQRQDEKSSQPASAATVDELASLAQALHEGKPIDAEAKNRAMAAIGMAIRNSRRLAETQEAASATRETVISSMVEAYGAQGEQAEVLAQTLRRTLSHDAKKVLALANIVSTGLNRKAKAATNEAINAASAGGSEARPSQQQQQQAPPPQPYDKHYERIMAMANRRAADAVGAPSSLSSSSMVSVQASREAADSSSRSGSGAAAPPSSTGASAGSGRFKALMQIAGVAHHLLK
jgi:hypothetical protein